MEKEAVFETDWNLDHLIRSVVIFCLGAEAVILLLDLFLNIAQFWYIQKFKDLRDLSNAALENSFGTWFSIVQNFAVAITALVIALHYKFLLADRKKFLAWSLIAILFSYISLDDHLVLHERLGSSWPVFAEQFLGINMGELPTYGWLFLFGPFFGGVGLFFLLFLYSQLCSSRYRLTLIVALSFWIFAVLLDAWDGTSKPYESLSSATGFKEVSLRHVFMLVEEMLEMLGSTAFLYLFLAHSRSLYTQK